MAGSALHRHAGRMRRIQALLLPRVATVLGVLGDMCFLCYLHCDWVRLHAFFATASKELAARYTYVCCHAGVAALGPGPAGRLGTRHRVFPMGSLLAPLPGSGGGVKSAVGISRHGHKRT